jgi:hypothetical protein
MPFVELLINSTWSFGKEGRNGKPKKCPSEILSVIGESLSKIL